MQIDLVSILLGLMVTFVQLKVSGRLLHRSLQCLLEEVLLVRIQGFSEASFQGT